MKFRCVVEYEYPVDHKPPVKAILYLHGDRIVTGDIEKVSDAVEVIRCKDCKYHGRFIGRCGTSRPNDFCSDAKRAY